MKKKRKHWWKTKKELESYNRYMGIDVGLSEEELNTPHPVHHCPSCKEYLWADKNHMSYTYCCFCGKNLRGVKLPYEFI